MSLRKVDREAPDVELEGVDNKPVCLATCWQDRPLVLLFLRHFG